VGIAVSLDSEGRWRPGRACHYLDAAYAEAVSEAGGAPVYLPGALGDTGPAARDAAALDGAARDLVARVDALILPGGDDFLPEAPYPPGVRFAAVAPAQLAFDRALLAAALARRIPVLGICYGLQLLALHHGGRLVYDIPTDLPGAGEHRLADPAARHALRIEPGTRLAAILEGTPPRVNSRHHQAVADPGRGLRVCARAEDGVVEAIEAVPPDAVEVDPGASADAADAPAVAGSDPAASATARAAVATPFVLGVQWHPESMDAGHRRRLFGAVVRQADRTRT
jgi:putative glutamine amidotransferase